MLPGNLALKVENLSKRYRIGIKENIPDSFGQAVVEFIRSPIKNYRKYTSLYRFDDSESDHGQNEYRRTDDVLWALKDVSFELEKGKSLGVIGRNGAGKSTLLKILSRITDPTSGQALVRGKVSSLLEVGTGFHNELTGRENVYLNATILGMKKREVDRKFDEIVDFSGVEKFLDTPVKRYSSGMKVRLAFSVAAHLEPEILIIDEVLAVGDAEFQQKCLNKMEDVGKTGRTVLFVSHNMPAVTSLCSRAILMDNGRVVDDGPSVDVVSRYLNSSTGTMAAHEWLDFEDAPRSERARLLAVRVRNAEHEISDVIDIRKPFSIEMTFDVLLGDSVLLPHFSLFNKEGQCAFITVDVDSEWRRKRRPAGRYTSAVSIPGHLLSDGMHHVDCYLLTLDSDTLEFSAKSAVAFNVLDSFSGDSSRGDYFRPITGGVRPLLKWTTGFVPADGELESKSGLA